MQAFSHRVGESHDSNQSLAPHLLLGRAASWLARSRNACRWRAAAYGESVASEREQARAIVSDALSGDLDLERFQRRWPKSDDPLLQVVFEETEDTVEHEPGSWFWFRRGEDKARFRKTLPYKTLVVDVVLLGEEFGDVPSERLTAIRAALLREINLEQENNDLADHVRAFVARQVETVR
jgi:plasmid stability protein